MALSLAEANRMKQAARAKADELHVTLRVAGASPWASDRKDEPSPLPESR